MPLPMTYCPDLLHGEFQIGNREFAGDLLQFLDKLCLARKLGSRSEPASAFPTSDTLYF